MIWRSIGIRKLVLKICYTLKMDKYEPSKIEKKWQKEWTESNLYGSDLSKPKKYYVLAEFPYPSGDLHMGHWFTFCGADIYARFKRMLGYTVFFPNGFDAFGLPAENAAIKRNIHPKDWTMENIKRMKEQFATMGGSFSYDHQVITCLPEYYRWNQWIFIEMFKKGLAYRSKTMSNWCPLDQTVLANEHVENGKCWRCGTEVVQKEVEQWFLKITDYAERLIWGKDGNGVEWPKSVMEGQNNWIGKSDGLIFTAPVKDSKLKIQTFSAHFEAFYADTFVVIAPDHPFLETLVQNAPNRREILDFANKIVNKRKEENYETTEKKIEGIFTGEYIVDPVGNGDLPIWVASYALKDYGTGIVKCSAHDERDFAFAKKYGIRLKPVLFPKDPKLRKKVEDLEICYSDMKNGILSEPREFEGRKAGDIRKEISEYARKMGFAQKNIQYHLHDWSVSRQRYWGTPVPIIYCRNCWEVKSQKLKAKSAEGIDFIVENGEKLALIPVPASQLPVELPYEVDYAPKGKPPLASNEKWLMVDCPKCGRKARRDAETMDTFVDSSWYFFRYLDPTLTNSPFDKNSAKRIMPVDIYFGGAEHTLGHTLYSRFFTRFFHDYGMVDFEEYAQKRVNHGIVLGPDGEKMSKSKGNVVNPDDEVAKYGADAVRIFVSFFMPYDGTGPWISERIWGPYRFLERIWKLKEKVTDEKPSKEDLVRLSKTIKKTGEDIEKIKFNTAIAAIMEWLNYLSRKKKISRQEYGALVVLLAPFAPHMAEELWQRLQRARGTVGMRASSVHLEPWPSYDQKFLQENEVTIVVQVNGRVRDSVVIKDERLKMKDYAEEKARKSERVKKHLEGKSVKKIIYVEGKIINFVT